MATRGRDNLIKVQKLRSGHKLSCFEDYYQVIILISRPGKKAYLPGISG
jgi:hypothetical protein